MPKSIGLNIYLAKPTVKPHEQALKDTDKIKSVQLSVDGLDKCDLWVKPTKVTTPPWVKFFQPGVEPDHFGKNSSTGAVLFAQYQDHIFLLAFGTGHNLIDKNRIETNFGLRTALCLVDETSLRSIDKSTFEQKPSQIRQQTGSASELQYFGIDVERDLLRAVTGQPKDAMFGMRISGMDALKLNLKIDLAELPKLFRHILEAYESKSYKAGPFSWVDHIGEVKDKSVQRKLDGALMGRIQDHNYARTWLTVPEVIDWSEVTGFTYSDPPTKKRYQDVRIRDMISHLHGGKVTVEKLKNKPIYAIDDDDRVVFHRQAYRFLYAEADYDGSVYILNNGTWYKVEESYAKLVNERFEEVRRYEKCLPEYNDSNEGAYNERVAAMDPYNVVLLDKKLIKVSGAASAVEPCDLFRDGFEFIHVKRYGGSSVLSHLFNQGLVSGEIFQREKDFRERLNDKLPDRFKIDDCSKRPTANKYQIVFAIISESEIPNFSVPFFSKISLRHVIERLESIGFDVCVAKITVHEDKK